MSKKVLISLMLVGILAVGAGFATFAWFTAEVSSENNEFTVGTFELNNGTDVDYGAIVDIDNAEPGVLSGESIFTITNTGSLDMYLRTMLNLNITDGSGAPVDLATAAGLNYVSKFEILPTEISYTPNGGTKQVLYSTATDFIALNEFAPFLGQWIPDANNGIGPFGDGDNITVKFRTRLNETAGNEYQASSVTGSLTVQGRQAVAGSSF